MSDSENKQRNREIAENEAGRQTVGDIRVSAWAIAAAVIIALAAVGYAGYSTAMASGRFIGDRVVACLATRRTSSIEISASGNAISVNVATA